MSIDVLSPDTDTEPVSPRRRRLYIDNDPFGGVSDLSPFRPFRIAPRRYAYLQWTLTMCPHGVVGRGSRTGFSTFHVDYTYFGFHKNQQVPLVLPVQIDNWNVGKIDVPC